MGQDHEEEKAVNVMITSASRKVWLVKAFKDALARPGGLVLAGDVTPLSPALYAADRALILPRDDDPLFEDTLLHLCEENEVRLLVPTRDEELPIFARFAERFLSRGVRVHVAGEKVVRTCRDKREFGAFCARNGFDCPRSFDGAGAVNDSSFPVFLKERFGKGGKGARTASDRKELELALGSMDQPVIQELVKGKEHTVDVLSDFEGNVISAIPRERTLVIAGESYVSVTRKDVRIIDETVRLSKALGLVGHNTVQCFKVGNRVVFIEVNPRFGGAANLGFAAGCNSPRLLVKMVEGKHIEPMLGEFKAGLVMMRYTQDMFMEEKALEPGPHGKKSRPLRP